MRSVALIASDTGIVAAVSLALACLFVWRCGAGARPYRRLVAAAIIVACAIVTLLEVVR